MSIATVSFVVNNTKPVTPGTRQRIERAMAQLGFRPNVVARALASRRTQILALVTPLSRVWPGAATREFMIGAARAAQEADHHLVIWPVGNEGDELVALLGQKLVDGVLLMSVQLDDARVEALRSLDTPFTLIGRTRDLTGPDYVDIDITASMRTAVDHLADERGIDPVVLSCRSDAASGRQAARDLLATAPNTTAVIIEDEAGAIGFTAELRHLGRPVPDRISVMDDQPPVGAVLRKGVLAPGGSTGPVRAHAAKPKRAPVRTP